VPAETYQEKLFSAPLRITTNPEQAQRVVKKLTAISATIFWTVQYCYLSGAPDKEKTILRYIQRALTCGPSVNRRYADPLVGAALDCMRGVAREAHRFKGLLRFQELQDNFWYAACEPDHCIVPLLTTHCQERFPEQDWIIHDVARDIAAICRGGTVSLYNHTELASIEDHLSTAEKQYQVLWKTFFKHIAIAERKNPKLQRQFMPKKYWKYLVEKR
jgi:probable DNA metabolism protein